VPPAPPLAGWGTFYGIVGSSAGALTGLQFVVIALNAQSRALRRSAGSLHAFGTPTVVHFGAVILVAAIAAAPWASLWAPGIALALTGAGGLGYTAVVILRARRQRHYVPVLEDWLWHAALPALAYLTLVLAALALPDHPARAPFWLAAAALLLLVTGIHNAWDAAAYIAVMGGDREERTAPPEAGRSPAAPPGGAADVR